MFISSVSFCCCVCFTVVHAQKWVVSLYLVSIQYGSPSVRVALKKKKKENEPTTDQVMIYSNYYLSVEHKTKYSLKYLDVIPEPSLKQDHFCTKI